MNAAFKFAYIILLACVLIFAFSARLENASLRLPHADESEQATTALKLLDGKGYKYNPDGPHGPTLYYYSLAKKICTGSENPDIAGMRKDMLFFTILLMCSYLLCSPMLGRFAAWAACGFLGLSGIAVIYSVYYVQETIFALAIFLTATSLWSFILKPSVRSAILLGLCAGFAQATKETTVIMFAGMFAALVLLAVFAGKSSLEKIPSLKKSLLYLGAAIAGFALVFAVFYSSFGSNPRGILDAVQCYVHFLGKSQSEAHSAPFYYYFALLTTQKCEGVRFGEWAFTATFIFGFICAWLGLKKRRDTRACYAVFLGLSSIFSTLLLSAIPYKTPWLLLPVVGLMCPVSGYGLQFAAGYKNIFIRIAVLLTICILAHFQIGADMKSSLRYHSDPRNPYLYSHTVPDFANLAARISQCVKFSDYKTDIPIAVITQNSPWPLPYYTRELRNAGYWNFPPKNLGIFDVVIIDGASEQLVKPQLDDSLYEIEYFGLRENLPLTVRIKKELFNKIVSDE